MCEYNSQPNQNYCFFPDWSRCEAARQPSLPDDHSESVPPLPIPNRTVKRLYADDSADSRVKVGNRQAPLAKNPRLTGGGFCICGVEMRVASGAPIRAHCLLRKSPVRSSSDEGRHLDSSQLPLAQTGLLSLSSRPSFPPQPTPLESARQFLGAK